MKTMSLVKNRMRNITEDESKDRQVGKQEQKSMIFLRRAQENILGKTFLHNRCF